MPLINMRQIKAHYSKVIGNEVIIRHVIELEVEREEEPGQRDHASCSVMVRWEWEAGIGFSVRRHRTHRPS